MSLLNLKTRDSRDAARRASCAIRALLLTMVVLITAPCSSRADYIAPGTIKIKTPDYNFEPSPLAPGTYVFDISWQSIPVASASIDVDGNGSVAGPFTINVQAKTSDVIDYFYRMRHHSEATFNTAPFRPVVFRTDIVENSSRRHREISFGNAGEITARQWRKNPKNIEEVSFNTGNQTLDPISAGFLARNMPLQSGAESEVDVFNGKHRYLIHFTVGDKEIVTTDGISREAFRVTPTVKKLTDSKGERRLTSAAIWIAADGSRDLLKLESKVWIGRVSAVLKRFIPKSGASPEQQLELRRARLATGAINEGDEAAVD